MPEDNYWIIIIERAKFGVKRIILIFKYYSFIKMFVGTSKERFFYHNTLVCLVRGLLGQNIIVDLRNDAYVCGKLDIMDG